MSEMLNNNETNNKFLSLQHVEKIYPNGAKAVYDFNLDVEKNEFIVIVGPSGCGKTTTLRMIAGLEDISLGEIYLENELLNYKPSKDRKIAIVFQNYALYPQMSVYENIAFPLRINTYPYPVVDLELLSCNQLLNLLKETNFEELVEVYNGYSNVKAEYKKIEKYLSYKLGINENSANLLVKLWSIDKDQLEQSILEKVRIREEYNTTNNIQLNDKFEVLDSDGNVVIENRKMTEEEIRLKVYSAAETLDLGSYLDRLPKQLSGGQMQRVALGRAIVKNVPLFLMDEPLSNLDAKLRLLMRSEIVKLHRLINTTTIYVTHDQTEAMTMATRIVVMSRGFVQQIGSPEEIYNDPANMFVAKFIGSPTMNFFKTVYKNGTLYLNENLKMTLPQEVVQRHDEFHKNKINELTVIRDGFASEETAKRSREQILKILSGLGDDISSPVIKKEKTVWDRIKKLFKKQTVETVKVDEELNSCVEKLEKLTRNLEGNHNVILGIRPDKLKVRFYEKGETLSSNEIKVNVTVSELLGDVYNVHFNFGKQDVVCKFNVERCIRPGDELVVKFDMDNVYLFDEVTGGRIH